MSIKKKKRAVNYTSRDYNTIKKDLVEYAKRYYPETYKDFSEASFGSLMLDAVAYIGDILSFYLDYQTNESFVETITEYDNLIKIGTQMGYKIENNASSSGPVSFYVTVPANSSGIGPDLAKAPVLKRGTRLSSSTGVGYMLNTDVDFSATNNITKVASVNPSSGVPTHYSIKSVGEAISGDLETETVVIGDFKKFRKIKLSTTNITEIISVVDSDGNQYYEVDNLSQDIIYKGNKNTKPSTAGEALEPEQIIKPMHAAYRFVTEKDNTSLYLKFGASSDLEIDKDFIADPSSTVLALNGKEYISDTSFDPFNLIESDKFGISPSNTTLTITLRTNSNISLNASVGQVNTITSATLKWDYPSMVADSEKAAIRTSLVCKNEESFQGSSTKLTMEELRERISSVHFSQNRAVTPMDYTALCYNMPPRFGSVKRVMVEKDKDSLKSNINIYTISERNGVFVKTNATVKRNLRTWLSNNKMMNDTIDIMDAKIVNFGINFSAIADTDYDPDVVEREAESRLRTHFARKMNIGEHISLTDIYSELKLVEGLVDVKDLKIVQKTSARYSQSTFNFKKYLTSDGRMLKVPRNVVMELKSLSDDINGVVE